ncbi:flavodoxin family protein [candidate division WOR-3 bacterium]|nr:flavodoxin family protein [candidate division WOR-3 bacterium]
MKSIVVFYSLEGNTEFLAAEIAKKTGSDILRLIQKRDYNPRGAQKYIRGGKAVMMKEKPELEPYSFRQEDYGLLFLGTPVWAGSFAPALRTFLKQNVFNDKMFALFCCHGGGKRKVFENLEKMLEGNKVIGKIDFLEPLKKDRELSIQKAVDWAQEMSLKAGGN